MVTKKTASRGPTPYSFFSGWVQDKSLVRVAAQIDEIARTDALETELMKYDVAAKKWQSFNVDFRAIRLVTTKTDVVHFFAVGLGGEVMAATGQSSWEEHVDDTDDGPRRRGNIRTLEVIGNSVFAAGMSRQVYSRVAKDQWAHADQGLVQARGNIDVSGINALDGPDEDSIIGVGFLGEIWQRKGGQWSAMSSPTNLVLHDVKVLGEDLAYCSGQEGLILRLDSGGWREVPQEATTADLWCIEQFQGKTYFGAEDGLYVLLDDSTLKRIDVGALSEEPFRNLHANAGLLLAVGTKGVLLTRNGIKWDDVSP